MQYSQRAVVADLSSASARTRGLRMSSLVSACSSPPIALSNLGMCAYIRSGSSMVAVSRPVICLNRRLVKNNAILATSPASRSEIPVSRATTDLLGLFRPRLRTLTTSTRGGTET
ncbi:Uncharacterised protein [Mycobacterium tuberculosis]|nr:Uncharacterised protein [Mycobacterium tuberculosis]